MDYLLSARVKRVKASPTLQISARAAQLRNAGKDIISLSAGEPDFNTPEHICEAAKRAIDERKTRYTPVDGIPELKQAVIAKYRKERGFEYNDNEVIAGAGGKQLIYNLFQAVLDPGDEILIPTPYWVSYPDMAYLADAVPVFMRTGLRENFKITADQLKRTLSPNSKLLIINSPSNPSGSLYEFDELERIAEVLLNHPELVIASDDIYEKIILGDVRHISILEACPELKNRTVLLNGVSKAYAMTGWRIGYAAGPEPVIRAMKKIQSQSTSNPASVSQYAAVAALRGEQSFINKMNKKFARRNRHMVDMLNNIAGVKSNYARGAFYVFADFSGLIKKHSGLKNDVDLADFILHKAGVAVVPGSAFGNPGYIRFSCAASLEHIKDALNRITRTFS